jgi:DNA-binding NtrC family response regulator
MQGVWNEQKGNKKGCNTGTQKIEWTGNIREFRNVLERLIILCKDEISGEDVRLMHDPFQAEMYETKILLS